VHHPYFLISPTRLQKKFPIHPMRPVYQCRQTLATLLIVNMSLGCSATYNICSLILLPGVELAVCPHPSYSMAADSLLEASSISVSRVHN
jgi:hypothetical protein